MSASGSLFPAEYVSYAEIQVVGKDERLVAFGSGVDTTPDVDSEVDVEALRQHEGIAAADGGSEAGAPLEPVPVDGGDVVLADIILGLDATLYPPAGEADPRPG